MAKNTEILFGQAGYDSEFAFNRSNKNIIPKISGETDETDETDKTGIISKKDKGHNRKDDRVQVWRAEENPNDLTPKQRRERKMDDIFKGK